MTLGNIQPPLTRRQAREAAQALEQAQPAETAVAEESPVDAEESVVADKSPESSSGRKPRPAQKLRGSAAKSAAAAESAQQAATAVAVEPPAAPAEVASTASSAGNSAAPASPSHTSPPRPLTRRELRALNAAEAADAIEPEPDVDVATDRPAPVETPAPSAVKVDSTDGGDEPTSLSPPVGHWSIDQGDEEVADAAGPPQSLDDLMSLGVGAGGIPTTTNALILPSIPNQGTTSGPLANTGEILITGSFDLPRSLGETGQHPNHFDSADVDQMMDQLDEFGPGDNAPVSASRAVSTHASTRNVMTPPKKRGVSLPVVLVVSTAALAVSVGALLFVGHLLQAF